jgi:hypothetical protein
MKNDIIVLSKRDVCPEGYIIIDTTSKNSNAELKRGLSPFYLGPIKCYDDLVAKNMENAWQYSKVYSAKVDKFGNPSEKYFTWRNSGFNMNFANRYPMGKGMIPLYSYWKIGTEYKKMGYIESRKQIYIPLYASAVYKSKGYQRLAELVRNNKQIALIDFDGYNNERFHMSIKDVINCEERKMGHAFVLKMLLEEDLSIKDGTLIDNKGILQ